METEMVNEQHDAGSLLRPQMLPRALRMLGAAILGFSAIAFSLQSIRELDFLGRYYSFLGFTSLLSVCGLLCAIRLKEDKGARTFLGMTLVFVPALFAQLGAFTYFISKGVPHGIPEFFVLTAPDVTTVLIAVGISLPLLAVISFSGMAALVRSQAPLLTTLFLGLNALLLIPVRYADESTPLVLLTGAFFYIALKNRDERALKTFEGRCALGALIIPTLILFCRGLFLYGSNSLHLGTLLAVAGFSLWRAARTNWEDRVSTGQYVAMSLIGLGWASISKAILVDVDCFIFSPALHGVKDTIHLPLVTLPLSVMLLLGASTLGRSARSAESFAGKLAGYSLAFQILVTQNSILSILGLLVASGVFGAAFLRKDKGLLYAGVTTLAFAIGVNLHYALTIYEMNPWLTLGVTGGVIILGSSLLEKNLSKLLERIGQARHELESWS